jgi:hypothetical protein
VEPIIGFIWLTKLDINGYDTKVLITWTPDSIHTLASVAQYPVTLPCSDKVTGGPLPIDQSFDVQP